MAIRRKKSYNDIIKQAQRIYEKDREANNGSWQVTPRQERVQKIANIYIDNIAKNRGKGEVRATPYGNQYTVYSLDAEKKYSYSARTGANG